MATKLGVFNEASLLLKQRPIASLSEQTPTRVIFEGAWEATLAFMIGAGNWHFGCRTIGISPEESAVPSFGYSHFFAKPDDYARMVWVSASPYGRPGLMEYSEEGDYWAASVGLLYLKYVSNGTSYAADLGKWTPHFTRAVAYELADRTAGSLTKASGNDLERLAKMKERALHKAKSTEAYSQPTDYPAPGALVQSRIGRRGDLRNR